MKKLLLAATSAFVLASSANAATFIGTRTVGGSTANLSITTDDTLGVLSSANILDWTISLSDGVDNFTLLGPLSGNNSGLLLSGSALTATATDLLFDFGVNGFALFQAPNPGSGDTFYCAQGGTSACFDFDGPAEGIEAGTGFTFDRTPRRGNLVLASVQAAVPEPATWAFMILGFGAIGGAMRRQKKQARKANVKVSYA
ncbi:MAG: PEPxxWA-CTERM sorting domain-containing protein [Pseudomonadota bacterium]